MRRRTSPDFPGSLVALPKLVEQLELTKRVHRLPESIVREAHQLAVGRHAAQRGLFENQASVVIQVIKKSSGKDKEPAVDPAGGRLRLFVEFRNQIILRQQFAEASRR